MKQINHCKGVNPGRGVFAGLGNFNGDNKADILFENPALGQYTAWIMSASGGVSSTVTLCTPGVDYSLVSIGDYTSSSASDLSEFHKILELPVTAFIRASPSSATPPCRPA